MFYHELTKAAQVTGVSMDSYFRIMDFKVLAWV